MVRFIGLLQSHQYIFPKTHRTVKLYLRHVMFYYTVLMAIMLLYNVEDLVQNECTHTLYM